jgi:hypothetical protein
MKEQEEHLQTLSDIRSMMERSSRFISLSGLSGVVAGIIALIGAYLGNRVINSSRNEITTNFTHTANLLFLIAVGVLILSVSAGILLTIRNSRKRNMKIWDPTAKRLLINLMIPLGTGGIFCFILFYHGIIDLVAPATLIFYGLSLLNASKYTFNDIRYLGICEIILGLVSSVYVGYGLLFWAFGFGVLHIIYGGLMYFKYERN